MSILNVRGCGLCLCVLLSVLVVCLFVVNVCLLYTAHLMCADVERAYPVEVSLLREVRVRHFGYEHEPNLRMLAKKLNVLFAGIDKACVSAVTSTSNTTPSPTNASESATSGESTPPRSSYSTGVRGCVCWGFALCKPIMLWAETSCCVVVLLCCVVC